MLALGAVFHNPASQSFVRSSMCVVVFSNADTRHAIKKRKVFLFFVFFCCGNEPDSTANLVVTHRSRGTLFVGFH
ncbi:unnamed protein product, partial [Ectocarpus sp. 8 AP-2014]